MVHDRISTLVETLSKLEGDELAAAVIREVQALQDVEQALPWQKAILYYLAFKKYNSFSWATKSQYVNRVDFLIQVFGGQNLRWKRLGRFLFSKDMGKVPSGFDVLECDPGKVLGAIGTIQRDEMTEELWLALRDPSVSSTKFEKLLHGDKQETA